MSDLWNNHGGKIILGMAAAVLVLGLGSAAAALGSTTDEDAAASHRETLAQLEADRDAAEAELDDAYDQFLNTLPGMDADRSARDHRLGQDIVQAFADTAVSSVPLAEQQRLLDARFDVLDRDSRALTVLYPELSEALGDTMTIATLEARQTTLSSDGEVSYFGVALFTPAVSPEASTPSPSPTETPELLMDGEHPLAVAIEYTVSADGVLTDFDGYLSSETTAVTLDD